MGVHGTPWHKGQSTELVIEIYVLRSAKVLVDTDHDNDGPCRPYSGHVDAGQIWFLAMVR